MGFGMLAMVFWIKLGLSVICEGCVAPLLDRLIVLIRGRAHVSIPLDGRALLPVARLGLVGSCWVFGVCGYRALGRAPTGGFDFSGVVALACSVLVRPENCKRLAADKI